MFSPVHSKKQKLCQLEGSSSNRVPVNHVLIPNDDINKIYKKINLIRIIYSNVEHIWMNTRFFFIYYLLCNVIYSRFCLKLIVRIMKYIYKNIYV